MKQMKKIAVIFLSIVMMLGCSSCNVNLSVNTDTEPKSSAEATETPVMPDVSKQDANTQQNSVNEQSNANSTQSISGTSAFYGVWCYGSKS